MMVGEARFRHETERLSDSAAHCFHCTSLDHSVGQILDALEASGFADRITVVDSSDHGGNLGARGLWKKSNFYPERVDIPLINVDSELGTWSAIPRSACWTCRRRFRISLARSCLAGHVAAGVSHRHRPTRTEPFLPSTMLPKLFQERTWSVAEGGNTAILLDLRRNFSIVKPIPRNWSIPVKVMSMRPYVLKYTVCFSTFAIRRKSATEPLKIRPH